MKPVFDDADPVDVTLVVNGTERRWRVPPLRRLLDLLREDACADRHERKAAARANAARCTVLVDGRAELACSVPVCQVQDAEIRTVESPDLVSIQDAFLLENGAQCGICTPG
jgi:carbon-monoxide dehydrogenase small subunit